MPHEQVSAIDKPSLLAAVARLRRITADEDRHAVYGVSGFACTHQAMCRDDRILADALLALIPAGEPPVAIAVKAREYSGNAFAIIPGSDVVHTAGYFGSHDEWWAAGVRVSSHSVYPTESAARLALERQSFWRHWELMGLGQLTKGET